MVSINRFGGFIDYARIMAGKSEMEKASVSLPAIQSFAGAPRIYFLTGQKFLYQTLFCIQSLAKISAEKYQFVLVSDGSFNAQTLSLIRSKLPGADIITDDIIEKNITRTFPLDRFPNIRRRRLVYPHLKKLTDIHTTSTDSWKVVLDSDMLFWEYPEQLIKWLKSPVSPIHMVDIEESYGYSKVLMDELCGQDIPLLLNVGIIGLKSSEIDWNEIEYWIEILEKKEGTSYYLEQALSAMLIAGKETTILEKESYIVNPSFTEIETKAGTLHHYVDLSKAGYFTKAWKKFI